MKSPKTSIRKPLVCFFFFFQINIIVLIDHVLDAWWRKSSCLINYWFHERKIDFEYVPFCFGCCSGWRIRCSSIPFPIIIHVVFMTAKICCKHFRKDVQVCNLRLDIICKVTRGFLLLALCWFWIFFSSPVFAYWPQVAHFSFWYTFWGHSHTLWDDFVCGFEKDLGWKKKPELIGLISLRCLFLNNI